MRQRLDKTLVSLGMASTRSQAENFIKLGTVTVNGEVCRKPGAMVTDNDALKVTAEEQYVSRAGLKLMSVAGKLKLNFKGKIMLDVGSSTGGFTDYALQHGAKRVVAVDVGTNQLHPTLRGHERIDLREQTDIRDVELNAIPDIVTIDVSFVSLRDILPSVAKLSDANTQIVAMVKPQFEAGQSSIKHKGVIKNDAMRRQVLKDFETWVQKLFIIVAKADSEVAGAKGNVERFYLLKKL